MTYFCEEGVRIIRSVRPYGQKHGKKIFFWSFYAKYAKIAVISIFVGNEPEKLWVYSIDLKKLALFRTPLLLFISSARDRPICTHGTGEDNFR